MTENLNSSQRSQGRRRNSKVTTRRMTEAEREARFGHLPTAAELVEKATGRAA